MSKYLIIILAFTLSGCSLFAKDKEDIVFVDKKILCDAELDFTTNSTLPVIWVKAKDEDGKYVIGLDGDNYTNLSLNTKATLEYMRSQKAYIEYMRGCIERHNSN